jgi:hypothetical protein
VEDLKELNHYPETDGGIGFDLTRKEMYLPAFSDLIWEETWSCETGS